MLMRTTPAIFTLFMSSAGPKPMPAILLHAGLILFRPLIPANNLVLRTLLLLLIRLCSLHVTPSLRSQTNNILYIFLSC